MINNESGGQKKRLQIALVMARDTDVIVMDEPENGLDNDARNDFRNIIRNVADEGKSILISSHDLGNIENMCDEIIFIDNGRILYKGIIDDVLSKVDKWTVKADETKLKDFVVSEITKLKEADEWKDSLRMSGPACCMSLSGTTT